MKLEDYLKEVPLRLVDFARSIPVSRGHLYHIMNGTANPSAYLKRRIEVVTDGKVKMEEWD